VCNQNWTIDIDKRIEAFQMQICGMMERISWTEHITNEEVLKMVEEKRSLIDIIRTRQTILIGHILKGDSVQREVMEGRMEGEMGRGRPRQKVIDWMMEDEDVKLNEGFLSLEFGPAGRHLTRRRRRD